MSIAEQAYESIVRPKKPSLAEQAFADVTAPGVPETAAPVDETATAGPPVAGGTGYTGHWVEDKIAGKTFAGAFGGPYAVPGGAPPIGESDMQLSEFGKGVAAGTERMAAAGAGTLGSLMYGGEGGRDMEQWSKDIYADAARPELQADPNAGPWGYIQRVTGETLPFMAATLAAGAVGGPIAAFAVAAATEGDNAYQQARIQGATQDQADTERLIVGTINGALELLQVNGLLKVGKKAGPALKRLVGAASGRAWGKLAQAGGQVVAEDLANAVNEGLQESVQEAVGIGAAKIHGHKIELKDLGQVLGAGLGGFTAGAILGVPGIAIAAGRAMRGPQTIQGDQTAVGVPESVPGAVKPQGTPTEAPTPTVGGVALLLDDGTVIKGQGKNSHVEIVGELPPERNVVDAGFLDEQGNYLYRDKVLATPQQQEQRPVTPEVAEHLQQQGPLSPEAAKRLAPQGEQLEWEFAPQPAKPQRSHWDVLGEIGNVLKTTFSSFDISAVMRQARMLGSSHPALYAQMIKKSLQAFASEDVTRMIESEYKDSPRYEERKAVGLEMPEWGTDVTKPSEHEERFMAGRILNWLPGIRASERSFTVCLNWLRSMVYDNTVDGYEEQGRPLTVPQKQDFADSINNLAGRATIKSEILKRWGPFLNGAFWSPRFAASRFKVLTDIPKGVFKSLKAGEIQPGFAETIRGVGGLIATNLAIMALVKMLDKDDEVDLEPDLRATDGGKIKIGNRHVDLWAGILPVARFLVRMATGEIKTADGRIKPIERRKLLWDFLQSKESPVGSMLMGYLTGENFGHQPFGAPPGGKVGKALTAAGIPKGVQGIGREIANRAVPGVAQAAAQALAVEGVPWAMGAFALEFFGAGVGTYTPSPSQQVRVVKNEHAKARYGKNWDDLTPSQQVRLRNDRLGIDQAETAARAKMKEQPSTGTFDLTEQNKVAAKIRESLPANVQQELNATGVSAGVSRRVGRGSKYYLNDEKYQRYQAKVTERLNASLPNVVDNPAWSKLSPQSKERILQKRVSDIKAACRRQLLAEIEREGRTYARK